MSGTEGRLLHGRRRWTDHAHHSVARSRRRAHGTLQGRRAWHDELQEIARTLDAGDTKERLTVSRAIETETYVCASAQTGPFTIGSGLFPKTRELEPSRLANRAHRLVLTLSRLWPHFEHVDPAT